jgi:hypothetical protein
MFRALYSLSTPSSLIQRADHEAVRLIGVGASAISLSDFG